MNKFGRKSTNFGYYAYIDDNNNLVIGEERGRDGGDLYTGAWQGMKTPYIQKIREEDPALFNEILEHFGMDFAKAIGQSIDLLLSEFENHLPKALYEKVKEECLGHQWKLKKTHILSTMDELKDMWEDGNEVVYVPAHFEKKKNGKK